MPVSVCKCVSCVCGGTGGDATISVCARYAGGCFPGSRAMQRIGLEFRMSGQCQVSGDLQIYCKSLTLLGRNGHGPGCKLLPVTNWVTCTCSIAALFAQRCARVLFWRVRACNANLIKRTTATTARFIYCACDSEAAKLCTVGGLPSACAHPLCLIIKHAGAHTLAKHNKQTHLLL